jgi:hypothetical protein
VLKDPLREGLSSLLRHEQSYLHGAAPTSVLGLHFKKNTHSKLHAGLSQVITMIKSSALRCIPACALCGCGSKLNNLNPKPGDGDD